MKILDPVSDKFAYVRYSSMNLFIWSECAHERKHSQSHQRKSTISGILPLIYERAHVSVVHLHVLTWESKVLHLSLSFTPIFGLFKIGCTGRMLRLATKLC